VPDVLGLLAWLHRDALVKAVSAEIDNMADDAHALSDTERQKRAAQLRAELLDLQREECELVEASRPARSCLVPT
jgi:hypothetical protein